MCYIFLRSDFILNGNVVNYDNFYDNNLPLWGKPKLDVELKKYLKLLDGNNVLDLGIGEGQNSIALSEMGYKVTGVDFSDNSLSICRKRSSDIELIKSDIRSFDIVPDKYDLIMSRCVLHFLHKDDVFDIVENIKSCLRPNGLVYVSVFSVDDPSLIFRSASSNFEALDNNVFHDLVNDTFFSYFSKEEVLSLFSGFDTVFVSDEFGLDLSHGSLHSHGVLKYVGRKV